MNITIRIIYKGYSSRLMRRGSFPVNGKRFKLYPDHEAALVAYEWLKEIRKEVNINEILEVMYNEDRNITDLVKKLDNAQYMDNLPF